MNPDLELVGVGTVVRDFADYKRQLGEASFAVWWRRNRFDYHLSDHDLADLFVLADSGAR